MDPIELLAPARDVETGIAAINCGADAVYIGASQFGAREAASNSIISIEQLCGYAHKYRAKIYAAVNTLMTDDELPRALDLIRQLYHAGVDALIIQDVGLLECSLPPLPLYASTQMHNMSPQKVAFLEKVGFQRVILARELSLDQINGIRAVTNIELETFIHGALCVSYSGQCYMSYALGGRSGNRGQCAQPCRRPYSLVDKDGAILEAGRHLLSLRDLSLRDHLEDLLYAGVTSFKIEGRLKDKTYVMNVVAYYRKELDAILEKNGLRASSSGKCTFDFSPDLNKTFNRGYTTYFINGRGDSVTSWDTPKSTGERIGEITSLDKTSITIQSSSELHPGDGICFIYNERQLAGTTINKVQGNRIYPEKIDGLSVGRIIFRNHDHLFLSSLEKSKTSRKISVDLCLDETPVGFCLSALDEDGNQASVNTSCEKVPAHNPAFAFETIEKQLHKTGTTMFSCVKVKIDLPLPYFIPVSTLNALRRDALDRLEKIRVEYRAAYIKRQEDEIAEYPEKVLPFSGNALNNKAVEFYKKHGVASIEPAAESGLNLHGKKVMTTKYCLKYQLGGCPKLSQQTKLNEPISLIDEQGLHFPLRFNCKSCEMEVFYE